MDGLPREQHSGFGDRPYETPHSERRAERRAQAGIRRVSRRSKYVELHAHSAYSFLDGASHPEELVLRAAELGHGALALTDHDGLYGSLEFAHAAKAFGVRAITGAEVTLTGGAHVTLLVESARGYSNLCRLLTEAHRHTRAAKPPVRASGPGEGVRGNREVPLGTTDSSYGEPLPPQRNREVPPGTTESSYREPLPPALDPALLRALNEGLVCLSGCARHGLAVADANAAAELACAFGPDRFYVELQRPFERGDARRNAALRDLAGALGVRTVATGDVHAHHRGRAALQDVLVAIRNRTSLEGSERERRGNHESVLRSADEMLDLFPDDRDAVLRSAEIAARLEFDLTQDLGYAYPDFSDGDEPAIVQLRRVCDRAFEERYGSSGGGGRRARERSTTSSS